jgi:hypothetical protein
MEEIHPHVQYLMKVGGFTTIDQYMVWLREPLVDWEEPEWGEAALRELGCLEEDEDDDSAILAYMDDYEAAYLQEKEDRLIRKYVARQAGEASA